MISGKTSTGFEFHLSEDALDDYELLEVISAVDKGDYSRITEMVEMLLGSEQKELLKENIRKENGRVSAKKMLDEVTEIFNASNELKN